MLILDDHEGIVTTVDICAEEGWEEAAVCSDDIA
jgi:hypothetical protein